MQVSVPYQLSDFQIIQTIGQGSFSKVKLVKRLDDNKLMALKQVNMDKLGIAQKNSALNQIRLLASIRSPFVISYQGSFYSAYTNSLCLLMQYAQDGDLQSIINKTAKKNRMQKGLPQNFIWKTLIHLLQALQILHENKIVHRDIKPANIFFNKGFAKLGDLNVSSVSNSQFYTTKTGTPYYTAPEIWKGEKYTTKCDIWSLGCIVYEMCSLYPPFRAETFPQLFTTVLRGDYSTLSQDYSQDLRTFVRICLVTQQSQRYSAAELLNGPIIAKRICQFKDQINFTSRVDLLKPIKCPKVLRFINQLLPQTNESHEDVQGYGQRNEKQYQKKKSKFQIRQDNKQRVTSICKQNKLPLQQDIRKPIKSTIRIKSQKTIKNHMNQPKSVKLIKSPSILQQKTQQQQKFRKQQKQIDLQLKHLINKYNVVQEKKVETKNNNFRFRSYKKIGEKQKENTTHL